MTKLSAMLLKLLTSDQEGESLAPQVILREKPENLLKILRDSDIPPEIRARLLETVCKVNADLGRELTKEVLAKSGQEQQEELQEKLAQTSSILEALESGPLRCGRFVKLLPTMGEAARAQVALDDGSTLYPAIPKAELANQLRAGDRVILDAQGRAIHDRDTGDHNVGEEGRLERRINGSEVMVRLDHDEKRVMHASARLLEDIEGQRVQPGASLLVSSGERFALQPMANNERHTQDRYLDPSPVPQGVTMGAPPPYVARLLRHAEVVMTRPDLVERWSLSAAQFVFLEGLTGSGKSMSIDLFRQDLAQLESRLTGVPVASLPPRYFALHSSDVYSKWLGDSDKALKAFCQEPQEMAGRPVELGGKQYLNFPVIAKMEEIDAVIRVRGEGDAIYDRIQTTFLQFLDPGRAEVRNRLVFYIATTNLLRHCDAAAVRRLGATIERFAHLTRPNFAAVLGTHLARLPLGLSEAGQDAVDQHRRTVAEVTQWVYSPNTHDTGLAEIVYGSGDPETKYRRHFMTGAVVAQGVAQAARAACQEEFEGGRTVPLTTQRIKDAIDQQAQALANQLSRQNVSSYLEVRDGVNVADVRRVRQPRHPSHLFRRAS